MNTSALSRSITNVIVGLIFWLVLLFSILLRDEITTQNILFDVGKALVVAGLSAFLLIIVNDALVKTLVAQAREHRVDRFKGGLSYHVSPPTPEEKAWRKKYKQEHGDFEESVQRDLEKAWSQKKQ